MGDWVGGGSLLDGLALRVVEKKVEVSSDKDKGIYPTW